MYYIKVSGITRKIDSSNRLVNQELITYCQYDKNANKYNTYKCVSNVNQFNQTSYNMQTCTGGITGECDDSLGLSCQKTKSNLMQCR